VSASQAVEQPIVVAVSVTPGGTRVTAKRGASAERLAQPDGISIFYLALKGYLTDMTMLARYGGVRRRRITGEPPSSPTVEVPKLFRPGLLIEVDVAAALPSRRR
jgi:hypothetical protein